jgi:hypothetical protein
VHEAETVSEALAMLVELGPLFYGAAALFAPHAAIPCGLDAWLLMSECEPPSPPLAPTKCGSKDLICNMLGSSVAGAP